MALILLSSVALTGCGDNADGGSMPGMNHGTPTATSSTATSSSTAAPAGEFNDSDVAFATQMISHHQQAVQMSSMALRRAANPTVRKLAKAIQAAQAPEIRQLTGWLTSWGKPLPETGHGGHQTMPGMMTEAEMSELGRSDGAAFDRLWTQLMIRHHQGAVTMAKAEQSTGKNAEAIALAKKIESDQNLEIATLQGLLKQLPAS